METASRQNLASKISNKKKEELRSCSFSCCLVVLRLHEDDGVLCEEERYHQQQHITLSFTNNLPAEINCWLSSLIQQDACSSSSSSFVPTDSIAPSMKAVIVAVPLVVPLGDTLRFRYKILFDVKQ